MYSPCVLESILEEARASLRHDQKATMSRTPLAEGILKSAAEGERDPERLRETALMAVAA